MNASNIAQLPTEYGKFSVQAFKKGGCEEHLAIFLGDIKGENIPCRIHSECLTGDTLKSLKCDCASQLTLALKYIEKNGKGVVVYLRQEGRGIGLFNKINAYALQDGGADTIEANNILGFPTDMRDYHIAGEILEYLGVKSVCLLTNNKEKIEGLNESGIKVTERIPLITTPNEFNKNYLDTKRDKMSHML